MSNDPYKILGVSPNASDDEVKAAYKELVKKYHPDKFQDDGMAEIAQEKMSAINSAYDAVMEARRGGSVNFGGDHGGYQNNVFDSRQIRSLIQSGNITQAESLLNNVPMDSRNAEWHFLMGSVCYKRGWLNDAYNQFSAAAQMDPSNMEYVSALNQMNRQRSGYMAGGPAGGMPQSNTSFCSCCSDLICADCCCELMGGDLIPCC